MTQQMYQDNSYVKADGFELEYAQVLHCYKQIA